MTANVRCLLLHNAIFLLTQQKKLISFLVKVRFNEFLFKFLLYSVVQIVNYNYSFSLKRHIFQRNIKMYFF